MIQYNMSRETGKIERVLDMPFIEASRVWACSDCGAKVFHCKRVSQPHYQCLCGGQKWKQSISGVK